MSQSRASRAALVLFGAGLVVAASACRRDARSGGGTIVVAVAADADNLLPPFYAGTQGRALSETLFDKLAEIGSELGTVGDAGFQPRLARSWDWSGDSLRLTLHLDSRARWHDGRPVMAGDVRFAFQVYADPAASSPRRAALIEAIDSVTVGDSLTCTVWYRHRSLEQFYALVSSLVPLPEHLLRSIPRDSLRSSAFSQMPVGSGPFRLVTWEKKQRIEIAAVDGFYRGRPKLDRVIWAISPTMSASVRQLEAGEADFMESLPADDAADVAKQPDLKLLYGPGFDYNFLLFNLHDGAADRPHAVLGDVAIRRALAMGLDRQSMVRSVLDTAGRVLLGPFVRAQWSADTTISQIPFARAAAARLLDSLGWHAGADGMRARNGRALAFTLAAPSSSKRLSRFAVLIQEQLRQVGARVEVNAVDFATLADHLVKRQFDAAVIGLTATPSPSGSRQAWVSATGRSPGVFNAGRYANAVTDAHLDSAVAATSLDAARAHYRAAYQRLVDDVPAVWLYEPRSVAGANTRVRTGELRADAWWLGLESWSIAPGGHLPRDAAARKP
jgi:peptide/nickel transport system substrate-binding protein